MLRFLLLFFCLPFFAFAHSQKAEVVELDYKGHNYLVFNNRFIIHDPDCGQCSMNPKVIYPTQFPNDEKTYYIINRLFSSPIILNWIPNYGMPEFIRN